MDAETKMRIDARLNDERNAEIAEALKILEAGDKESLKDVATRRMWQAMPDAMRLRGVQTTR